MARHVVAPVGEIPSGGCKLVSVGNRHLEGHDRPEEVYVVQHEEVGLEAGVAEDDVEAALS